MKAKSTIRVAFVFGALVAGIAVAAAQEEQPTPPRLSWSFSGPFGKYDQAQLQRGFKVYREVCSTCHSLNLLSFRDLADPYGPGFTEAQAQQIASEYKIKDIDDKGQPIERPGRLADHFPPPFPNEAAAKATYGVAPPDMSTLAKARGYRRGFPWFIFDIFTQYQEEGPDYIAAYLQGYTEPPKGFELPAGGHYNVYFPGHNTAMPQPLQDGQVTYDDGSPQTVQQYARDVAAFLMWAAEPHLVARKRIGFQVLIYLIVLAGLLYFTKKRVWHAVEAPHAAATGQAATKTGT
jgi:ubiquinol-cytochrome c reductase cytochrome b/c1 subunit